MKTQFLRRTGLAAALALSLAVSMPAAQAQVAVDVNITLDGIVILYYYDVINVSIDSAALSGLFGVGGCGGTVTAGIACAQGTHSGAAAYAAGQLNVANAPFAATPAPGAAPANVPLFLENVWAVRAIANAGQNVQVSVVAGADPLVNGAAQITFTGASVAPASFAPPGLVNPQYGSVTLGLNLTGATAAGTYSSASGTDYTLNVELI